MNGREQTNRGGGGERVDRGGRDSTGAGQHPASDIQHPTSKGENGRRAAYDLEERLLAYAVSVVRLVDLLPKSRAGDHLGGQLLRSGTSPALNHGEAQAAESLNDFTHKMKICLKELRESRRTLRIIAAVPLTRAEKERKEVFALTNETEELIRIFSAGIRTASNRRGPSDGGSSGRLREDVPSFGLPTDASLANNAPAVTDPITGAQPWMLDVECWMLDVEGRASKTPNTSVVPRREEAQAP